MFLDLNSAFKKNIEVYGFNNKIEINKTINEVLNNFDTSNFSSGIYFVKVKSKEGVTTKKLLKINSIIFTKNNLTVSFFYW